MSGMCSLSEMTGFHTYTFGALFARVHGNALKKKKKKPTHFSDHMLTHLYLSELKICS